MTGRRVRESSIDEPQKPDFNDAGFGQVGCLFIVVGMVVGVVLTVVLAFAGVPVAIEDSGDGTWQLLGIAAFAYAVGTVAAVASAWLVEHVRVLWRFGGVPFLAGAVGGAVVFPVAAFVPGWGPAMGPILVGVLLVVVGGPLLLRLIRVSMPGPPDPPSRYGR